jgi:hypothetical protein
MNDEPNKTCHSCGEMNSHTPDCEMRKSAPEECGIITLRNFQGPLTCAELKPCWMHDRRLTDPTEHA